MNREKYLQNARVKNGLARVLIFLASRGEDGAVGHEIAKAACLSSAGAYLTILRDPNGQTAQGRCCVSMLRTLDCPRVQMVEHDDVSGRWRLTKAGDKFTATIKPGANWS